MEKELTKERIEKLDLELAAFPLSMMQDFLTFQIHCERTGIDAGEIPGYLRYHLGENARVINRKAVEATRILIDKSPKCPVCKMVMSLEPINDDRTRMIDDHSKSWWVCPDPACSCEPILDDKYPHEILMDLGVPVHKPFKPQSSARRKRSAARQRNCGQKRRQAT